MVTLNDDRLRHFAAEGSRDHHVNIYTTDNYIRLVIASVLQRTAGWARDLASHDESVCSAIGTRWSRSQGRQGRQSEVRE